MRKMIEISFIALKETEKFENFGSSTKIINPKKQTSDIYIIKAEGKIHLTKIEVFLTIQP